MKIVKVLKYLELLFLASLIILPIIIFATPLSIHFVNAKVGYEEGDVIQLTITEYSFEYNLSYFEDYNVTAGIYLGPYFNFSGIEEKEAYTLEEIYAFSRNIMLFEGNSTSQLQFSFQIDKLSKHKYSADATLLNNSKSFIIGDIFFKGLKPFFEPSIAIGLTFTEERENETFSYINWRKVFLFSAEKTRDVLNWYSKYSSVPEYDFARYDKNTFTKVFYNDAYFSATTYILMEGSHLLKEVETHFEGYETIKRGYEWFHSNITQELNIPDTSYWNYNLKFELQYFRGGEQL